MSRMTELLDVVWSGEPWFLPGSLPPLFVPCEPWPVERLRERLGYMPTAGTLQQAIRMGWIKSYVDPIRKDWCGYVPGPNAPSEVQSKYDTRHPIADTSWRDCWKYNSAGLR
jgi:hypothetical protein